MLAGLRYLFAASSYTMSRQNCVFHIECNALLVQSKQISGKFFLLTKNGMQPARWRIQKNMIVCLVGKVRVSDIWYSCLLFRLWCFQLIFFLLRNVNAYHDMKNGYILSHVLYKATAFQIKMLGIRAELLGSFLLDWMPPSSSPDATHIVSNSVATQPL